MKILNLILIFFLLLFGNNAFASDEGENDWVPTLIGIGAATGGVLNATSIGFNLYNTINPKPMGKTNKGLTYGTLAVGTMTLGTGVSLFVFNNSRATSTNVYNSIVVGAGAATIGTGILSLVLDKKQKNHASSSVSVIPIVSHDDKSGTMGGLFLSKGF